MENYHAEIEGRWRKTAADEQSQDKTSKYSHTDFATAKVDQVAATELFGYTLGNSLSVTSKKLQAVVVAHA